MNFCGCWPVGAARSWRKVCKCGAAAANRVLLSGHSLPRASFFICLIMRLPCRENLGKRIKKHMEKEASGRDCTVQNRARLHCTLFAAEKL